MILRETSLVSCCCEVQRRDLSEHLQLWSPTLTSVGSSFNKTTGRVGCKGNCVVPNALVICFPVGWPPGHFPELCFVTNKNHSEPWVKGIKLRTNSPSLGGEYEHPQHTILYKLSRRTKQIIVTPKYHIYLSLVKMTNKCIQFFGTLFAHFHSSIMALGKELFTLPVALENQNERKLWSRAIFRWPNLEQIPWLFPRGPAKSFPKLNNSHPLREKKEYQNCTIAPGFPGDVLGVEPRRSKW